MVRKTLGTGLEVFILWLSAANNCQMSPSFWKVTNRKNVRIPRPPTHCIKLLHRRMGFDIWSRPVKTVIPVVVKPDTDSKKESTKDAFRPKKNGKPPTIDIPIHAKAHRIIPPESLRGILTFGRAPRQRTPRLVEIKAVYINDWMMPSSAPMTSPYISGISSRPLSIRNSQPIK